MLHCFCFYIYSKRQQFLDSLESLYDDSLHTFVLLEIEKQKDEMWKELKKRVLTLTFLLKPFRNRSQMEISKTLNANNSWKFKTSTLTEFYDNLCESYFVKTDEVCKSVALYLKLYRKGTYLKLGRIFSRPGQFF